MKELYQVNKKAFSFKLAFHALIAVSLLVIAFGVMIVEWNDSYGSGVTYDLGEYDLSSDLTGEAQSQKDRLIIKNPDAEEEDFEGTMFRGVFGLINTLFESFDLVLGEGGMIDSIARRFSIPDIYITLLLAAMFMTISFAIVTIIFRRQRF